MRGVPHRDDLWGKLTDETRGGPAWHPLVDHCADVACVLEALISQPTVRQRLARAAALPDLDPAAIGRLSFLAFIHDLGKCAAGFQAKAEGESHGKVGHLAALKPLWCEGELFPQFGQILAELGLARIIHEASSRSSAGRA
jgi:CRISPR-associated endonuclease/helicase Cas3